MFSLVSCAERKPSEISQPSAVENRLIEIAQSYESYEIVTPVPRWALSLCINRAPLAVSRADADARHSGKLYTLHTNDAGSYIRVGDRSHENTVFDDGFAVVKASWSARVHDRASGQDGALVRGNDGNNYEQDEPSDLYIIAKMRDAPASETDGGWVYGIVARGGERVLESGRIDSCIRCHSKAPSGGLFGLDAEGREAARASLGFSGEVQGPQS